MGDAGLEKGRDLRGGQAVIARLTAEDALEHGIGDELLDQVLTGSARPAQQTGSRACSLYGILYAPDAAHAADALGKQIDGVEVAIQPFGFMREAFFEIIEQVLFALGKVETLRHR